MILVLLGLVGIVSSVNAQLPSYVPKNGLVGWWPFTGNANDISGNGNNGSVQGAILTADRNGEANKAYSFDGNGDFIDCGNAPSVNVTGSLTIHAWVLANDFNNDHGIVSKMNGGSYTYDLTTTAPNSQGTRNKPRFLEVFSITPLQTAKWVNIVTVFDQNSQKIKYYINGSCTDSADAVFGSLSTSNDHLFLGAHQPSVVASWSWSGKLDDVGIWARALTTEEIQALYKTECIPNVVSKTVHYSTSDQQFKLISPQTYLVKADTIKMGKCDSITNHYAQFQYVEPHYMDTVTVTDTLLLPITTAVVNNVEVVNLIKVFPNPSISNITIDYGDYSSMKNYTLEIVNSVGVKVFSTIINQQSSYIDLSSWTGKGMYILRVLNAKSELVDTRKIILE